MPHNMSRLQFLSSPAKVDPETHVTMSNETDVLAMLSRYDKKSKAIHVEVPKQAEIFLYIVSGLAQIHLTAVIVYLNTNIEDTI